MMTRSRNDGGKLFQDSLQDRILQDFRRVRAKDVVWREFHHEEAKSESESSAPVSCGDTQS